MMSKQSVCGVFQGKIVINSSVGTKQSVEEKESIISVRYGQTNLSSGHCLASLGRYPTMKRLLLLLFRAS